MRAGIYSEHTAAEKDEVRYPSLSAIKIFAFNNFVSMIVLSPDKIFTHYDTINF